MSKEHFSKSEKLASLRIAETLMVRGARRFKDWQMFTGIGLFALGVVSLLGSPFEAFWKSSPDSRKR